MAGNTSFLSQFYKNVWSCEGIAMARPRAKEGPETSTSFLGQQTSFWKNQKKMQSGDCFFSYVFIISTCFDFLLKRKINVLSISKFSLSRQES